MDIHQQAKFDKERRYCDHNLEQLTEQLKQMGAKKEELKLSEY